MTKDETKAEKVLFTWSETRTEIISRTPVDSLILTCTRKVASAGEHLSNSFDGPRLQEMIQWSWSTKIRQSTAIIMAAVISRYQARPHSRMRTHEATGPAPRSGATLRARSHPLQSTLIHSIKSSQAVV